MTRRKIAITMPSVLALAESMRQEGNSAIADARRARKEERRRSRLLDGKGFDDATAERIAKAGAFAVVVEAKELVETVSADDVVEVRELPVKRRVIRDAPFDRLIERRIIAKDDGLNEAYRKAGEQLLRDVEIAGLNSVRAMDPGSVGGARVNDGAFVRSDIQRAALYRVLRAKEVLRAVELEAVDLVLMQRHSVTTVGKRIAPGRSDNVAAGVAVYVLQTALNALVEHYGLAPPARKGGQNG